MKKKIGWGILGTVSGESDQSCRLRCTCLGTRDTWGLLRRGWLNRPRPLYGDRGIMITQQNNVFLDSRGRPMTRKDGYKKPEEYDSQNNEM